MMRQFHARAHFARVEIIDAKREAIRTWLQERSYSPFHLSQALSDAPEPIRNRYDRLCRAASLYRVAGFLSPQEL